MKRTAISAIILICLTVPRLAMAADTKVNGRMYSDWTLDMTDGAKSANEFSLGRTYVTVKSKLSDRTSVRITSDLRENEDADGHTQYDVIIKYGYIDWKPTFGNGVLQIRFGLQPTPYIDYQNKLWGRRYLSKTVGDKNKLLTTSDLGASASVDFGDDGKTGSIMAAVYNGTSYSDLGEMNKQKNLNLFARVTPLADNEDLKHSALIGQFYTGTQNEEIVDSIKASDYKMQIVSIGGLLAYRGLFDVGGDVNFTTMGEGPGNPDTKSIAMSVFGSLYMGELTEKTSLLRTLNLFGRLDILDPNTDSGSPNDGNKHLIAGIECNPTKGFKASVNIRNTSFDDSTKKTERHLVVNTLFKF